MKRYTKKQLINAFIEWRKLERLYPQKLESKEEFNKLNIDELGKQDAEYIISLIEEQKS